MYVLAGELLVDFGPDENCVSAIAGDFLHIPALLAHRERNISDTELRLVVVRSGQGPITVEVAGPDDH